MSFWTRIIAGLILALSGGVAVAAESAGTTSGFLPFAISPPLGAPQGLPVVWQGPQLPDVQSSLTAPAETHELAARRDNPVPLYQMGRDKTKRRRARRKRRILSIWAA